MLLGAVTNANISKSKPSYQYLLYSVYLPSIAKIIFNRAVYPKAYCFAPSEGYFFQKGLMVGWKRYLHAACIFLVAGCDDRLVSLPSLKFIRALL